MSIAALIENRQVGAGILLMLGMLMVRFAFPIADAMWRYNRRVRGYEEFRCIYRAVVTMVSVFMLFVGWMVVWTPMSQ